MSLPQKDLHEMLDVAVAAAKRAGRHALEELGRAKGVKKSENELVTQADAECQRIIIELIRETYPDHGLIAEEGEKGKMFRRAPVGEPAVWWAVDPIDGTNNFAHGIPVFATSIGVLAEGEPVVGVIYQPATDSLYTAIKGGPAHSNGRRISAGDGEISPVTSVGLDSHFERELPAWVSDLMRRSRFRNFGTTALHLSYVASGGLVAALMCTPKLWDIAAGVVIAQAAGALVTDWEGSPLFPIDLDHYDGGPFRVVAANRRTHPQLLRTIRG